MKVLAVISARAGSKGVKLKNLRMVGGKPLMAYIIEAGLAASRIDRLIVSTESEAIADVARSWGADVPFLRPPELAQDHISLIPVADHAMRWCDEQGWTPDVVVSIQPTSPLLEARDIDRAIMMLEETGCDSVVGVTEILQHHPFRAMSFAQGRLSPFTEYTSERYLQKQDRPTAHGFTGGLYVRRRQVLEQWSGKDFALGRDVRGVFIEPERAVNIDHEVDLVFFEALLRYREGYRIPVADVCAATNQGVQS
jgi:CMP-N-acetylneuraminic acid synthetase